MVDYDKINPDDVIAGIADLHYEVRELRGKVRRLEDEKKDLRQEIERTRQALDTVSAMASKYMQEALDEARTTFVSAKAAAHTVEIRLEEARRELKQMAPSVDRQSGGQDI